MPEVKEVTKTKKKLKKPKLYKVLMHNDNYTTMEFVVEILEKIFNKRKVDAVKIMLQIHNQGSGLCGVYPFDIAVTKVEVVHFLAEKNNFPLKCSIEPEDKQE
jgi:ATP-dependent Clp protease adaptor protein ClpS